MSKVKIKVAPGEVLREEFIRPLGLSARELTIRTGLDEFTLLELLLNDIPIDPDIAQSLASAFNTTPKFWMNLQKAYDKEKS